MWIVKLKYSKPQRILNIKQNQKTNKKDAIPREGEASYGAGLAIAQVPMLKVVPWYQRWYESWCWI